MTKSTCYGKEYVEPPKSKPETDRFKWIDYLFRRHTVGTVAWGVILDFSHHILTIDENAKGTGKLSPKSRVKDLAKIAHKYGYDIEIKLKERSTND